MQSNILDSLWIEKYRPKKLDDVVLEDDHRNFLGRCIQTEDVPSILFIGPQGSGKTTTARIMIDSITNNEMDLFTMNGSDDTGVDNVRNDIQGFLKTPAYNSKLKIVFIDEFDYMSKNAQAALRGIMEKYAGTGRFICTANYMSKIIEPLQSRFQIFEMKTIQEEFAVKYCKDILEKESVEYDDDTVRLIVSNFVPDVRRAVNTIQKNVIDGKLKKVDAKAIITNEKLICALLVQVCDDIGTDRKDSTINQNMPKITELLSTEPDYLSMYQVLFGSPKLPLWAKIKVNEYSNKHQGCAIPSAHFMAMVYDIVYAGIKYFGMFKK